MNNEFTETQSEVTDGSRSSNLTPMQPEEGPLRLETVSSSDMDAAMWPSVEVRETLPSQHSPRFTEDTNTVEESNASSSLTHNRDSRDVSREIFVGDLSFFCRDHHLVQLFGRYGVVEKARVRMSDNKKNSLMFAFIRMKTAEAATIAAEALNGFLFMGRTLRVQLCNVDGTPSAYEPKFGFQIHVSFISYQTISIYVTEETLRSLFEPYGLVTDAVVCRHTMHMNPPKQSGYGFVYMEQQESTMKAIGELRTFDINGIRFECSISHRSNHQPSPKNNSPQSPTQSNPSQLSVQAKSPRSTPSASTSSSSSVSESLSVSSSLKMAPPKIQIPPVPAVGVYLSSPTYALSPHHHHPSPSHSISNSMNIPMQTVPMQTYQMHPGNTMYMYADGHMMVPYVPGMPIYSNQPNLINANANPAMRTHHSSPSHHYQPLSPSAVMNVAGNQSTPNPYMIPNYCEMAPRGLPVQGISTQTQPMVINTHPSMQMAPPPPPPSYPNQMSSVSFPNNNQSVENPAYIRQLPDNNNFNNNPADVMYPRDNRSHGPQRNQY